MKSKFLHIITCVLILFLAGTPLPGQGDNNAPVDKKDKKKKEFPVDTGGKNAFWFTFGLSGTTEIKNRYLNSNGNRLHDLVTVGGGFTSKYFTSKGSMSFNSDGKFRPSEKFFLGHYMQANESYIAFHAKDTDVGSFLVEGGNLIPTDAIETPYSVFITSMKKPMPGARLRYETKHFHYETRWIMLTQDSSFSPSELNPGGTSPPASYRYPNKSVNFMNFGFEFGDFRFGGEDVVVYLGRPFDALYFFSPLPQFFHQLILNSPGKPWSQDRDDKSMMGFYFEWGKKRRYEIKAQIMIDDINASILPGINPNNLTKIAWSLGGYMTFDWGKLGLWHGGALKYTYQATYTRDMDDQPYHDSPDVMPWSIQPYEYTYYPVNEYSINGSPRAVWVEDLYLGYKYGENAISFMVDYEKDFFTGKPWSFTLYAALEYVVNGKKAPHNPWHEHSHINTIEPAAELLSGPVQEHRIIATAMVTKKWKGLTVRMIMEIGGIFNRLKLVDIGQESDNIDGDYDTTDNSYNVPKSYIPQKGEHLFVYSLSLGVTYDLYIMK